MDQSNETGQSGSIETVHTDVDATTSEVKMGPKSIKILNLKKNDIDLLTLSADMLDIYFEDDIDGIKQIILDYQFLNNRDFHQKFQTFHFQFFLNKNDMFFQSYLQTKKFHYFLHLLHQIYYFFHTYFLDN